MDYSEFQNSPSSEKITLAILSASKRLMGWTLHSGSVYKIENFTFSIIDSLKDSGVAYTEAASAGAVVASQYYLDRSAQTLYLRTSDSVNPNGKFLVAVLNLYFANVPVTLPHDLADGIEVYWEPSLKTTSEFGVAIDTIAQSSEAIEGAGSLTIHNDFDFWKQNFDKLVFENQRCKLYSYSRDLAPEDARLIYKGRIESKAYAKDTISLRLKDQFAELRSNIALETVGSLEMRTGTDMAEARLRLIMGRVTGIIPVATDRVLDGYPITGTISVTFNTLAVTGVGTAFLTELSPGDELILDNEKYSIAEVTSNTALTLSTEYLGTVNLSGASVLVDPDQPKRWMNRTFTVAGHALRQPETTTMPGSTIIRLIVEDASDFYPGDIIYIGTLGSGETVEIESVVNGRFVNLVTSLSNIPPVGTLVLKPAIQNVRIDDMLLRYYRDYTFDAETAELTLRTTAESNAAPVYQFNNTVTFTSGSRNVTGSGFSGFIKPGYMLGLYGNAAYFEVLSVVSDTAIILRTAPGFNLAALGRFKSKIYDDKSSVLTLDALGRTVDGETDGALVKTAPGLVKALLEDAGLSAEIDETSFEDAEEIAYQHLGVAIPDSYNDKTAPTYRDTINRINKSVFGSLVQTTDYKFGYEVLRPYKSNSALLLGESDILGGFTLESKADNVVKTVNLEYAPKEYDYISLGENVTTVSKVGENATYLVQTDRSRTISTLLVEAQDAEIMVNRWSFLLSIASNRLTFVTKMQGMGLEIGDIIEVNHRKLFERFGGTGTRKLLLVESVLRNGSEVKVEAADLSNTFNRVAAYNEFTENWVDATEDEKLYGGYYTDEYGLIDNDASNFETNLYW
jgi:hypothetical protein